MRFGKTLQQSVYAPWKAQYMDYAKLKDLLRADRKDDEQAWTEEDENQFCDEIFNVQLDKVAKFQEKELATLKDRVEVAFEKLKEMAPTDDKPKSDITNSRLKELKAELDAINNEVKELKKYSSANYTGFLKIVKKHDRKRGDRYKVRPLMRLTLSNRGLNSESAYTPLLRKLSTMYYIIDSHLEEGEQPQLPDLEHQEEVHNGEKYTAQKFWIHPDNLLEVKAMIGRRLPALVYSESSSKEVDGSDDPSITSLYFDNSKFDLYTRKVERQTDTSSFRLRWYGQLSTKPEIMIEQKIIHENGSSEEKKFSIKDKYIKSFIDGNYKMEKTVEKMERQGQDAEQIEAFRNVASQLQEFVTKSKFEPVVRANYTRAAFQKPADDRVRVSIDSNIAFIREDTLDKDRPCRDPQQWHRTDIDNSKMTYPFSNINQSEVSKFPYSVLEIKIKESANRKRPAWVEDLMASHLVHSAPRFSKFAHGVASLFEDHVNNLPFWLSDLETDIRKDPHKAFEEEEQRKVRRAENEHVVGSFLGKQAGSSSYKPAASSPIGKSYMSERVAAEADAARSANAARDESLEEDDATATEGDRNYGTSTSVFPSFSIASYARFKRDRDRAKLPEGVFEPKTWLKNAGPLQIEPKVWLANERTFLKWQHICILLGSLSVGLYTAAGENFLAECMGIAYIVIAVMAGIWGYYMLHRRRNMIVERSGKDFDNSIGPLCVSVALMIALILNFVFAYRAAFAKARGGEDGSSRVGNTTIPQYAMGEL
ncbi:VTC domain-containing protein [Apiospora kogelbergensis]|uniref:VTC domain-containing protein n=1 Tax=Apiospora kogelbergensis TaxID=1337665 RepID=UPI00312D6BC9